MTYETKSGARYTVEPWIGGVYQIERATYTRAGYLRSYQAKQKELRRDFHTRAEAEAALKAYAETHGWRRVE